jgi:integrase/recombinase XerD
MSELMSSENRLVLMDMLPPDQHPVIVFLSRLTSPHSRRNLSRYLNQVAQLLTEGRYDALGIDWTQVRFQHTAAIRAHLSEQYAAATVNGMLSAVRGVLKTAWELGLMSAEDYQRAANVENVKAETLPAGRELEAGEVMALSSVCVQDDSPAGARDAAMIGILYVCGMRRAELAGLERSDFELETGKLTIRSGKGRKARTVYATGGALMALKDWLLLRGDQPGPLFTPIRKGGWIELRTITAQSIYEMLKKRAVQAGVSNFSPHDFRRTFVGDLLDAGVDIATIANIAGHASTDTTRRYDRRPEEVKRTAAEKLHFPYQRKIR